MSVSESPIGLEILSGMIFARCVGTTHFSRGTQAMTSTEDQVNIKSMSRIPDQVLEIS